MGIDIRGSARVQVFEDRSTAQRGSLVKWVGEEEVFLCCCLSAV